MGTHHARVIWAVVLLCALVTVHPAWAGPPTDQLRDGVDRLIQALRDPGLKGDAKASERRAAIGRLADEIFDFTETAKRALGQHWALRAPAEREDFIRLFTALVQRTYIARVEQYDSEMQFRGDAVDGDQAVVRTTLAIRQGSHMALDYRMHRPGDRWRVYDISVDGISLVANYRAQFNKIIRTESYEALVVKLKSKTAEVVDMPAVSTAER